MPVIYLNIILYCNKIYLLSLISFLGNVVPKKKYLNHYLKGVENYYVINTKITIKIK